MTVIPESISILVIGGGPGGSYAAACLAREGLNVLLLEADKFPRYHIGESMLPSIRHFLRFIDLEERFVNYGFYKKVGAAFKLGQNKPEGYTDFIAMDKDNFSWNVVRSEADEILFRHAAASGAVVLDQIKVTDINFDGTESDSRPVSASWRDVSGNTGTVSFDFLIDASGRRGLLSTRYLKNRQFNQSLKNIAMWAYWKGTKSYQPDTPRAGSPYFEALTDESGWAWFIPLHNGTTSVGIVVNQAMLQRKKEQMASESSLTAFYIEELKRVPGVLELIGEGVLIDDREGPAVLSASDYSYSASSYAGPHYRIVGDAAAFIDPFFSNGVHLAISGALSAAATICASLRGDCTESEAGKWHTSRIGTSYTRFLVVVLSAYRQMRAQHEPVLADIDENNFDRAFEHFRGVIQGNADITSPVSKHLTQDELLKTLEFCAQAYIPPSPEDVDTDRKIQLVTFLSKSETLEAVGANVLHGRCMRVERGALGLLDVDENLVDV